MVIASLTYTATVDNTSDSGYRAPTLPASPANWKAPIDYTAGTAYARFEILDKPSDTKTVYNVCLLFVGNKLSCMALSPPYTGKSVNTISGPINGFWNYDKVDWTMGVNQVELVLKDENGTIVQGDPKFYPTTIKTTITIVPAGGTYVPPDGSMAADAGPPAAGGPAPANDAGAAKDAGASVKDAGALDAGPPMQPDASHASAGSSSPSQADAAAPVSATSAGSTATGSNTASSVAGSSAAGSERDSGVAMHSVSQYLKSSSSCSVGAARGSQSAPCWVGLAWLALVLRRRRAQRR